MSVPAEQTQTAGALGSTAIQRRLLRLRGGGSRLKRKTPPSPLQSVENLVRASFICLGFGFVFLLMTVVCGLTGFGVEVGSTVVLPWGAAIIASGVGFALVPLALRRLYKVRGVELNGTGVPRWKPFALFTDCLFSALLCLLFLVILFKISREFWLPPRWAHSLAFFP